MNKRLDKIRSNKNIIKEKKYEKLYNKYSERMQNLQSDLHNKSAQFLLKRFKTISIGKVSTKQMVSNLTGNLYAPTKRQLMFLSHYRFRMKLHQMKVKYGSEVREIDEYLTSKTCSICKNIKKDLGKNKVYNCDKCKLKIDRDINASINIYNIQKYI